MGLRPSRFTLLMAAGAAAVAIVAAPIAAAAPATTAAGDAPPAQQSCNIVSALTVSRAALAAHLINRRLPA